MFCSAVAEPIRCWVDVLRLSGLSVMKQSWELKQDQRKEDKLQISYVCARLYVWEVLEIT